MHIYIIIIIVTCESVEIQNDNSTASMVMMDYTDPAVEGANVTFSCPSGLVLIGPIVATCMRNGKWEPDPWEVACKGKINSL
jgi:hypothetical protein